MFSVRELKEHTAIRRTGYASHAVEGEAKAVVVKPAAEKELLRLAERDYVLLVQRLASLAEDPRPGGAMKLRTKAFWRVRLGHFRIIYRIDDDQRLVEVVRIARRSEDTYKGL